MSASSCCSSCGCNPCGCGACNYTIVLPDEPAPTLNFSNINIGGIGVLDSASGVNINFRGVSSGNAMLVVTLDNVNHNVLLTLDATAIASNLPVATTAQAGVLETATDAEAIAKAATDKIVTPSNFAAMAASTTFAGFAEIATQAEVIAGVSATTIVAPDTLAVLLATKKNTATWADAVARAALVPTFEGQFGYQLDTNNAYVATGAGAGAWSNIFTFGQTNLISANSTLTFSGGASIDFTGAGGISVSGAGSFITITGGVFEALTGIFNLDSGVDFQITGSSIPANNLVASAAAGQLNPLAINTFLSTGNTQTGYTNFTNPAVLRTCDTATVTLPQLAQIVGTLINDLKAVLLPAT